MNSRAAAKQIFSFPFASMLKNFQPLGIYFARNRWALGVGLLSLLLVDFLLLLIPLVIKRAIDLLVTQTPETGSLLFQQGMIIVAKNQLLLKRLQKMGNLMSQITVIHLA